MARLAGPQRARPGGRPAARSATCLTAFAGHRAAHVAASRHVDAASRSDRRTRAEVGADRGGPRRAARRRDRAAAGCRPAGCAQQGSASSGQSSRCRSSTARPRMSDTPPRAGGARSGRGAATRGQPALLRRGRGDVPRRRAVADARGDAGGAGRVCTARGRVGCRHGAASRGRGGTLPRPRRPLRAARGRVSDGRDRSGDTSGQRSHADAGVPSCRL